MINPPCDVHQQRLRWSYSGSIRQQKGTNFSNKGSQLSPAQPLGGEGGAKRFASQQDSCVSASWCQSRAAGSCHHSGMDPWTAAPLCPDVPEETGLSPPRSQPSTRTLRVRSRKRQRPVKASSPSEEGGNGAEPRAELRSQKGSIQREPRRALREGRVVAMSWQGWGRLEPRTAPAGKPTGAPQCHRPNVHLTSSAAWLFLGKTHRGGSLCQSPASTQKPDPPTSLSMGFQLPSLITALSRAAFAAQVLFPKHSAGV